MQAYALTLDTIKAWGVRKNLPLLENKELGQLALQHPKNKGLVVRFIPRPERNLLTIALPLPFQVTEEQMPNFLKGLSLANSSTFAGSWVLNHSKGETYFRITLPTVGTGYTDQSLDFLVSITFGSVDKLGPRLLKIAHEGADPRSVLDE